MKKDNFIESLNQLITLSKEQESIGIEIIFNRLAGRGVGALLVLFSLPFCLPIQIPGFSTPFGLLLAFLGLRIAFGKELLWPKFILNRKIPSHIVEKIAQKCIQALKKAQKILHPRLEFLATNPIIHRINGLLVVVLALFLSLPLPIPMTNMFSAMPILCMGLGLLEEDGLFILISYFLTAVGLAFFATLIRIPFSL